MALLTRIWVRRTILACAALGIAGCGALVLMLAPPAAGAQLAEARARWAARSFSHYRLVVEEATNAGSCGLDIGVQDERIQDVFANDCVRLPSWTISSTFTWAEQLGEYKSRCYPTAVTCVCHSIYTAHASYDPRLGYPRSVTYQWELQPNWSYSNHWRRLWQYGELPNCQNVSRFAAGYISVTVVSLTPLP